MPIHAKNAIRALVSTRKNHSAYITDHCRHTRSATTSEASSCPSYKERSYFRSRQRWLYRLSCGNGRPEHSPGVLIRGRSVTDRSGSRGCQEQLGISGIAIRIKPVAISAGYRNHLPLPDRRHYTGDCPRDRLNGRQRPYGWPDWYCDQRSCACGRKGNRLRSREDWSRYAREHWHWPRAASSWHRVRLFHQIR